MNQNINPPRMRMSPGALRGLRRAISTRPDLYLPIRRFRKPDTVVEAGTELLIEGFPRSGNTWTEALIRHCRPDGIRLAHHSHAAAHVIYAKRLGVPVLVLYRHPDAAVQSLLTLYDNRISARDAYRDYAAFYEALIPLSGPGLLQCSFEDVTERPGRVVDALNQAFGLGLNTEGLDTREARDSVFRLMDAKGARLKRRDGKSQSRPGTASDSRLDVKQIAVEATHAPVAQPARKAAFEIFERLREAPSPIGGQ